jgi:hypothetical protein
MVVLYEKTKGAETRDTFLSIKKPMLKNKYIALNRLSSVSGVSQDYFKHVLDKYICS